MHVITRKRLNDFADRHLETRSALAKWYRLTKAARFRSFAHLRETFASADQVGKLTVFNIGGNKVRLIAAIHYNRGKVYNSRRADPRRIRRQRLEEIAMTTQLKASLAHWPEVSQTVFVPHSRREYDRLVLLLDDLIDEVGEEETHPLASLMEVIGLLIEKYEDETVPELS